MSGLISGNEAKLAWANGEQLQVVHISQKDWNDLNDKYSLAVFTNDSYIFRIKPQTITINGIEVPAPFEPKEGETYWFITDSECGYNYVENKEGCRVGIAAWCTEDEIKQVVAALRQVFFANAVEHEAKAQAVPQDKGRSDFEIINQTIELVDLLASANRFQRDKSKPFPFDSDNPRNIEWWRLACKIQELLTNTDPTNCDFEEYKAMIEAQENRV